MNGNETRVRRIIEHDVKDLKCFSSDVTPGGLKMCFKLREVNLKCDLLDEIVEHVLKSGRCCFLMCFVVDNWCLCDVRDPKCELHLDQKLILAKYNSIKEHVLRGHIVYNVRIVTYVFLCVFKCFMCF